MLIERQADATLIAAMFAGGLGALAISFAAGTMLANRGFRLPDAARRIGHIDGLRGYLALFVLLSHYVQWTRVLALDAPWGAGPDAVRALGQVPVAIFFMITGLLFYPKARAGLRATRWPAFVVARVFRIYPLALVSVAAVVAILWHRSGFTTDPAILRETAVNLISWLTFVDEPPLFGFADSELVNAGVFWTLLSEWLFYLAVLPAIAAARSLTAGYVPGWATPLWAIPAALVLRVVWPGQADYMLPFMLGMAIAEVRTIPRAVAFLRRRDVAIASLLLMGGAVALLPPPIRDRTAMFYAPFLACVACGQGFRGLFAHPASIVLGEISFGIYVIHGIVLWLGIGLFEAVVVARPALAGAVLLPALALATVLVAALLHVLIERPMIAAGRRVARRPRPLAPSTEATLA